MSWKVLPILAKSLPGNWESAFIDINKKNGVSFNINPKIRKIPKSSGNRFVFCGLLWSKMKEWYNLKTIPLDENKYEIPTAIITWGKAINGAIILKIYL